MQHPDEGLIHTWLDGELPADEASSLEAHVAECPECSAKVAEARGLVAASSRIVSALDLVPSGVIPAASPKRRPWYASSQLRAAAAVVIVAGASFLVMENRDKGAMGRIMSTPAEAPSLEAGTSAAGAVHDLRSDPRPAANVDVAASAPVTMQQKTETPRRREKPASPSPTMQANEAEPLAGRVAGVSMERSAFAKQADSSVSGALVVPLQAEAKRGVKGGVARGVEAAATVAELRKVRSDTSQSGIRTIFEVSRGIEVTLTDVAVPLANIQMRQKAVGTTSPAPPPSVAAAPEHDAADAVPVNTISWTDKRGHKMMLTGRMPPAELELIRQRLPEDQR
jgi:anti-sigma factor RsiW